MRERNYPYILKDEQEVLGRTSVALAGLGIGSVIAETLVRMGVGRLILVDGDTVELSNLNRQNYTRAQIGLTKVEATAAYLRSIDPGVEVIAHEAWITAENCAELLTGTDYIINTVDFDGGASLLVSRFAREAGVVSIFPLNLGWGSVVYVSRPDSPVMDEWYQIGPNGSVPVNFILNLVEWLIRRNRLPGWFERTFRLYQEERSDPDFKEPQLHIGCLALAAQTASVIFSLVNGEPVPCFPNPVFVDHRNFRAPSIQAVGFLRSQLYNLLVKRKLLVSNRS